MMDFIRAHWLPLALVACAIIGLRMAYTSGYSSGEDAANTRWSKTWADHQLEDQRANAEYQAEQRALEQERQRKIDQGAVNAQKRIDQINADLDIATATSDSVQRRADSIAAELERSKASLGACSSAASQAAAAHARVLADVLKRADTRAGILAAVADQAIERGSACEGAYDAIMQTEASAE